MTKKKAVIDGSNIAYVEKSSNGTPKISNITAVRRALQDHGFHPIVIVDASLVHKIDDPKQLEALLDKQIVRQAPAEADADYFVLETADRMDALVVSNDRYEPYQEQYPWIHERRIPVMIVEGEVELYEPNLEDRKRPKS